VLSITITYFQSALSNITFMIFAVLDLCVCDKLVFSRPY